MQSRKSIPNVGRRAQGRKALFMLKGSGVSYPSCGDPAEVARRGSLKHGSLTLEGVASGGELGESPATYDESVLSQPSHPYNRIIQRILLRHQAAERKELHRMLRPEGAYTDEVTESRSAPPSTRNNPSHSPALSHSPSRSPPGKTHSRDDYPQPSKAVGEEAAENSASRLQWADILQAKHRASHEDPLDLQSYTLSSPEDQSVSSLDLAKGYLTDRGLISDPRGQDMNSVLQEGSLDTTRSEPCAFSSLPRLVNRKRDLQPLDDVLDYFWVYQGMSRQLLDRHSPSYLWNKEWFQKKPTKLPPLYIATGQKTQRTLPNRTSSVQFSRVSSEEVVDTPEGTPREKNGTNSEQKSQHSRRSLSSELQSNATQTQTDDDDGDDGEVDDDDSSCQTLSPEDRCHKGQGRRVMLVVKMPVLTHETTSADLLDND